MTANNPNTINIQSRSVVYTERTNRAEDQLLADIAYWCLRLPKKSLIKHHVNQFHIFCERAFNQLNEELGRFSEDDVTFKSQVIGVLTTQWMLLRDIAVYRIDGSPYQRDLNKLDQEVARYYRAIRSALPEGTHYFFPHSTPLITLGRSSEFFLFNDQDQMPPALISIPFGAIYDSPLSRSRLAIAHEIGHAVFNRIKPFLPELESKVRESFDKEDPPLTHQERVVREVIIQWLSEIVADLVGTGLAGPTFAMSAFSVIAGPKERVGITDDTHPVGIIRPYIYLEYLNYLKDTVEQEGPSADYAKGLINDIEAGIVHLKTGIENFSEEFLDRRFASIPALTNVNLEMVRDQLQAVTRFVLNNSFNTLGGDKFGKILTQSAINMQNASQYDLEAEEPDIEDWGENLRIDEPFVLDVSNLARPTFAVATSLGDFWCDYFGICS